MEQQRNMIHYHRDARRLPLWPASSYHQIAGVGSANAQFLVTPNGDGSNISLLP